MLTFILLMVLVMGVNTALWGMVGAGRAITERLHRNRPRQPGNWLEVDDVAVLIAAHNEELVIANTIRSAAAVVPMRNIFVASDGSTDATARVARENGASVVELTPNRGKAGALVAGLHHFALADGFEVVLFLDADTQLAPDYLETGLPYFDDPGVVAVAGRATTIVDPEPSRRLGRFLLAYRERFYVVVQFLIKYGQAARRINVVSIVPGFASMYRSRVLASIDIAAPGLAIEDFNMTFEVHALSLGRIAFHPMAAIARTQDPVTFGDYTGQLRRWTLGFWQTVRRHGFHIGLFWWSLALYVVELVTSSVMMLLLLPVLFLSTGSSIWVNVTGDYSGPAASFAESVPPALVAAGVLLPDYLLTIFTVIVTRRYRYLYQGLGFPLMRIVDAAICLWTLPRAFIARSSGVWESPARRTTVAPYPEPSAAQTAPV